MFLSLSVRLPPLYFPIIHWLHCSHPSYFHSLFNLLFLKQAQTAALMCKTSLISSVSHLIQVTKRSVKHEGTDGCRTFATIRFAYCNAKKTVPWEKKS